MWVHLKIINIYLDFSTSEQPQTSTMQLHRFLFQQPIGCLGPTSAEWRLAAGQAATRRCVSLVFLIKLFISCEEDWGSLDFKGDKVRVAAEFHSSFVGFFRLLLPQQPQAATQQDLSLADNSEVGTGWEHNATCSLFVYIPISSK